MDESPTLSPALKKKPDVLDSAEVLSENSEIPHAINLFATFAELQDGLEFVAEEPKNGKNFKVEEWKEDSEEVARYGFKHVFDKQTKKYLRTEKTSNKTESVKFGTLKIKIGKNFTNADIPKLIRKIKEKNDKIPEEFRSSLETPRLLAEKYRKKAAEIATMLKLPAWNSRDETTRDARKIWSRRAFHAFALAEAFQNGRDLHDPNLSADFEKFLAENSNGKVSENLRKTTARLVETRKWTEKMSRNFGNFSREMAEIFAADSKIFSLGDFDQIQNLLSQNQ